MMLKDLIDNRYTDKDTVHSYIDLYQSILGPIRESTKKVFETGIYKGGSTKLWSEFFPNAQIYSIDITLEHVICDISAHNITTIVADSYNPNFVKSMGYGTFDFIIDDGPHTLESMIACAKEHSKLLAPNGVLIIEDIQSPEWIRSIILSLPKQLQATCVIHDHRTLKGRWDDIVLVVRSNSEYVSLENLLTNIATNSRGVEIGGPSKSNPLYANAVSIDNIVFSKSTIWANHTNTFNYYPGKSGNVIINDAVDISNVKDSTYEFVFSSHCLEHIANPLKALFEWSRILKEGGYIVLILPEKSKCFDHKRSVSSFSTIISQYVKNVNEDDLSTLPEILEKHDLSIDLCAGTFEQFQERSLNNFENRCLHHYVYSPELLKEMCEFINFEFIYTETIELDMWFIIRKPLSTKIVPFLNGKS